MLDFCTVLIASASPCYMFRDQGMCRQRRFSDHHETMLQPHPPQPLHTITTTIPPQCAHLVCLGILEPTYFKNTGSRYSRLFAGDLVVGTWLLLMTFERCKHFTRGWKLMDSSLGQHEQLFFSATLTLMRSAFSFVRISFPGKMCGVQETFDHIISLKMMKPLKHVLSFAPSKLIFLPPKPHNELHLHLHICLYRSRTCNFDAWWSSTTTLRFSDRNDEIEHVHTLDLR